MHEDAEADIRDSALISAAQRVERYEIRPTEPFERGPRPHPVPKQSLIRENPAGRRRVEIHPAAPPPAGTLANRLPYDDPEAVRDILVGIQNVVVRNDHNLGTARVQDHSLGRCRNAAGEGANRSRVARTR